MCACTLVAYVCVYVRACVCIVAVVGRRIGTVVVAIEVVTGAGKHKPHNHNGNHDTSPHYSRTHTHNPLQKAKRWNWNNVYHFFNGVDVVDMDLVEC
jgi:hypothetical protein